MATERQDKRPQPQLPLDNGALRYNPSDVSGQDPSALTTQQLLRENFWLRELLESRINGIEERIEGGNKAVQLLQAFADRTPTTMDVQNDVKGLREVVFVKLDGVKTQLEERDTQIDRVAREVKEATEKNSRDVKSAVDAAFAASKEVVSEQNKSYALSNAKSEAAFTKQIDAIGEVIKTTNKGVDDKINDIKDRITSIESRAGTVTEVRKDTRDNMGLIVSVIAVAIALGVAFIKH